MILLLTCCSYTCNGWHNNAFSFLGWILVVSLSLSDSVSINSMIYRCLRKVNINKKLIPWHDTTSLFLLLVNNLQNKTYTSWSSDDERTCNKGFASVQADKNFHLSKKMQNKRQSRPNDFIRLHYIKQRLYTFILHKTKDFTIELWQKCRQDIIQQRNKMYSYSSSGIHSFYNLH